MIKKNYLNKNLISQEINNKLHILINKQKDCVLLDKNRLGSSSYQNYFSLEIDENKNYEVNSNVNNKNGNIVGKNLLLTFEKLKQENKKQFNLQNNNDVNCDLVLNDLINENNKRYKSNKFQPIEVTKEQWEQILEDWKNIENDNYLDNVFYLGYNKYEKIIN